MREREGDGVGLEVVFVSCKSDQSREGIKKKKSDKPKYSSRYILSSTYYPTSSTYFVLKGIFCKGPGFWLPCILL